MKRIFTSKGLAKRLTMSVLLLAIALGSVDCSRRQPTAVTAGGGTTGEGTTTGGEPVTLGPDVLPPPAPGGNVGLKRYEEIQNHYSGFSGVPVTDPSVAPYWEMVRSFLPANRQVDAITPAMVTALVGLGGVYCKAFIVLESNKAAEARKVYNMINFSTDTLITEAAFRDSVVKLARLVWLREPTEEEITALRNTLNESISGAAQSSAEVKNSLLVLCTTMLASLQAITI